MQAIQIGNNMVSVIAKNIRNRRDHKALSELFKKVDVSGDGTISIEEYVSMCETYGIKFNDADKERVREIADAQGEICKNDFIRHIKDQKLLFEFRQTNPDSDHHWQKITLMAFRLFDKNGDGFMTKKEFRWMTTSALISHETIDCVFRRFDLDENGKLDVTEFAAMIQRHRWRKEAAAARDEMERKRQRARS